MTENTNKEKALANTYIELYKYEQNGQYDRALKTANRILQQSSNETTAIQCKAVCLIQLSKFEEALNFIKKFPDSSKNLAFEKAYCQYRLNQPTEALKTINEIDDLNQRLLELKAQVLYRLENFFDAFNIYKEITKAADDEYEDERSTNMSAALVYAGSDNINQFGQILREDTYELCFNKACQLIAAGQYGEAEKKLRQCEKLCRDSLEEDGTSEEDIQIELAHVRIQLGYIYHKQGRVREAQQLYITSLKLKLDDIALTAVASNNIVVINKDQNVFDSKKKMKAATNEQLNFKLLSKQRKYIALNNALFNYYTNQFEQCKRICNTIEKTWPDLGVNARIIAAMTYVKSNNYSEALNLLETYVATDSKDNLFLQLTRVQLWLMQGDRNQACKILERAGDNRYLPGSVGALITLYLAEAKEDIAQNIYKETVDWYRDNKNTEGDLTNLWRQAAEFHIRNGQATVAANSLEELLRANPNDKKAQGQLIIAYSEIDKEKCIKLASELFSVDEISKDLDIETVESSVWLSTKKPQSHKSENSPSVSGTPSGDSLNVIKKKKQHKRKGKLPKNYDPKIPPDPERWLPKYERSGYRKKRDRRTRDVIKGSQGTASGQAELFDFSSKSAVDVESHESTSSVETTQSAKSHQKGRGQQKKKNKRR